MMRSSFSVLSLPETSCDSAVSSVVSVSSETSNECHKTCLSLSHIGPCTLVNISTNATIMPVHDNFGNAFSEMVNVSLYRFLQ